MYEYPKDISYAHAAYTETLACTMYGILKGNVTFGNRVAIIGCGGVGLTMLQLAKLRGATHVIMLDVDETALEPLRRQPGVYTINPSTEDAISSVRALTEGHGADTVIEAGPRRDLHTRYRACPPGRLDHWVWWLSAE